MGARLRDRRGSLFDRYPAAGGGGTPRAQAAKSRFSRPISTRARSPSRATAAIRRHRGRRVSEERLRRFFTREGDHYRMRQEVRDIVLFATHSLLKDPPFSRLDLISCRNVLIYLDRELAAAGCSARSTMRSPRRLPVPWLVGDRRQCRPACSAAVDRDARIYSRSAARRTSSAAEKPFSASPAGSAAVAWRRRPRPANSDSHLHRRALEELAAPEHAGR